MTAGRRMVGVLGLSAAALLGVSAPALAAAPEAPSVVTVESLKATSATFHGILNPLKEGGPGTYEAGTYEFLYRQSPTECKGGSKVPASPAISLGGGMEGVSQPVSGLKATTKYTACLLARNGTKVGENEAVGAPVTFETATPPQTPETTGAKAVTATTALLEGVLNPIAEAETGWHFLYSTEPTCVGGTEAPGEAVAKVPAKTKKSLEVAGLQPNKEYKFCLVATNSAEEATVASAKMLKTLPMPPTIATVAASEVKSTAATLEGQINPNNEKTKYTFEYSTQEKAGILEGTIVKVPGAAELEGFPEQRASVALSGLNAGEAYYYQVVAENEQSKKEGKPVAFPVGSVRSFTTVPAPSTDSVMAITATTATFNGHLKPLNGKVPTQYHFNYKLSGSECAAESSTPTEEAGTGAGTEVAKTANVTALEPNHEYTVCFVTSNASGSAEGAPVHFTTPAAPPKILSEGVSGVTSTEATLEAKVNPNNHEVTYKFEYATNPALIGATAVAGAAPLSGFSSEGLTATVPALTGLKVGETYYYRVVVKDEVSLEVIDGATQSLTPVGAPLVSTGEAQSITATAVMLPGTVSPAGSTTAYHVAYISQAGYEAGLTTNPANPFALAKVTLEERSVPAGFEAVSVKLALRELTPSTMYEAVLIAANATGTTVSSPIAFTTAPAPPVESTGEPAATGPAPVVSPFPAATLPAVIPYTTIAQIEAKEPKSNVSPSKSKKPTKAQLLAKALKSCHKYKNRGKRTSCEQQARKRYAPAKKK